MKCPYGMNEVHTYRDDKTWVYKEFAKCYEWGCPYWYQLSNYKGICCKAEKEC